MNKQELIQAVKAAIAQCDTILEQIEKIKKEL